MSGAGSRRGDPLGLPIIWSLLDAEVLVVRWGDYPHLRPRGRFAHWCKLEPGWQAVNATPSGLQETLSLLYHQPY
jgi:hypothetical protein